MIEKESVAGRRNLGRPGVSGISETCVSGRHYHQTFCLVSTLISLKRTDFRCWFMREKPFQCCWPNSNQHEFPGIGVTPQEFAA
jgi:hypothetical protein